MTRQDAIEYDNWLKSGLMQEAEVLGLGEKAAVSYTHLTLPTIRLV